MSTKNIEIVDSNQDLTIQCATIPTLFECQSPTKDNKLESGSYDDAKTEDEFRRIRGTIIENKTNNVIHKGNFFPYEFTENEEDQCLEKMIELNHNFKDMNIGYSYEGTIIRIFYYKQWYISTHRKLDSGRSKWGSNNSFKFLFEQGLKNDYNITLTDLLNCLNLRCQYTFMIMADENTRFVCTPNHTRRVYFIGSNDSGSDKFLKSIQIDKLPKPTNKFETLHDIFQEVKGMKYPYLYQGYLLIHKNGSQYRIISDEYAKLFKVRNNEQSIPYRYLQLKGQNNHEFVELLKKLFPHYVSVFESYEEAVLKLANVINMEYNKRKQRSLLPSDLTQFEQIDQKLYLFIKNKLLKLDRTVVTVSKILELLWLEETSNLNHMIRMIKYNQRKENEQKLIIKFDEVQITPPNTSQQFNVFYPKKKKTKYSKVPIEFTCRKRLF